MYCHLAHLDSFEKYIKTGVKVRRGDLIGKAGKSGTRYVHVHFEVMKSKPERWNQYVFTKTGPLTKEQTMARYADPSKWIDKIANFQVS